MCTCGLTWVHDLGGLNWLVLSSDKNTISVARKFNWIANIVWSNWFIVGFFHFALKSSLLDYIWFINGNIFSIKTQKWNTLPFSLQFDYLESPSKKYAVRKFNRFGFDWPDWAAFVSYQYNKLHSVSFLSVLCHILIEFNFHSCNLFISNVQHLHDMDESWCESNRRN